MGTGTIVVVIIAVVAVLALAAIVYQNRKEAKQRVGEFELRLKQGEQKVAGELKRDYNNTVDKLKIGK